MIQFAFAAVPLLAQNEQGQLLNGEPPKYTIPACSAPTYDLKIEKALYGNACTTDDECTVNAQCYYRWNMCYGQTTVEAYLPKNNATDNAKAKMFNTPYAGQSDFAFQMSNSENAFPTQAIFQEGLCIPFQLMNIYIPSNSLDTSLDRFKKEDGQKSGEAWSKAYFAKKLNSSCNTTQDCCTHAQNCNETRTCENVCLDTNGAAALSAAVSGVVAAAMLALVQL